MAAITVQDITRSGLQASYTAVASSHTFTNDGRRTFVHVANGVTAMVLTIVTSATADTLAITDRTVSIGSNEDHFVGPFPTQWYGSTVTIQFDETSDGTVAAIKLPAS